MYITGKEKENVYDFAEGETVYRKSQVSEKSSVSNGFFPKDIRVIYNQTNRPVLQYPQIQDVRISKVIQKCDGEFIPNEDAMQEEFLRDAEETEAFIREYMQNSSEQIPARLILQITDDVCYGGSVNRSCVWITMTGSRAGDKGAAYQQLRDEGRPIQPEEASGYVWHHIPNAGIDSGNNECQMVLVEENYHKTTTHIGAVKQYERYSGQCYQ